LAAAAETTTITTKTEASVPPERARIAQVFQRKIDQHNTTATTAATTSAPTNGKVKAAASSSSAIVSKSSTTTTAQNALTATAWPTVPARYSAAATTTEYSPSQSFLDKTKSRTTSSQVELNGKPVRTGTTKTTTNTTEGPHFARNVVGRSLFHPLPSSTHHPLSYEKKDEVLMKDEAIDQKYEVFKT
jgi:hypothetical protein